MAKYDVLEDGTVINVKTGKKLKPFKGPNGYYIVWLCENRTKICKSVHRLVAEKFISNPENKSQVNHVDGNKLNNHVSNLEWSTRSENVRHALQIGLNRKRKGYICWDNNNETWLAKIEFNTQKYVKYSKHDRKVCEKWLEDKRKELGLTKE